MRQSKNITPQETVQRIALSTQSIGLSGVFNCRELGGYENADGSKIKRGILIRSGQLCDITKEDKDILLRQYELGTVIDLRSKREVSQLPDPIFTGVRYRNYPVTDEDDNESRREFSMGFETELYYDLMCGAAAKEAYKNFFECLLSVKYGSCVLFHSVYGKDRAGVAAALLLSLLDVSEDIMTEDYLLTNKVLARSTQTDGEQPREYTAANNVYAHSLEYALAGVSVEYGSVRDYIKEIAVLSENNIKELKRKFLE